MLKYRWLLALPLALAVTIGSAAASSIRDDAALFAADAVRAAEAKLKDIERETGVTTTIESLDGRSPTSVAIEHARRSGTQGIYILIPKEEHKVEVLSSPFYRKAIGEPQRLEVRDAFVNSFRKKEFDTGLKDAVETIGQVAAVAHREVGKPGVRATVPPLAPMGGRRVVRQGANSFGLGSLLGIGLLIVAVLVGIRLIGALFGAGRGSYGPGPGPGMGQPGMGPGGYGGGPGYGGRGGGGGFFSSILGGIGGAMAGNWLYDQFSGRQHGGGTYADTTATPGVDPAQTGDAGGDWAGGGAETGDWGGGDAGGGDAGGDWGGGGGDWGGGGGGGGDWGGGGGDGGSW